MKEYPSARLCEIVSKYYRKDCDGYSTESLLDIIINAELELTTRETVNPITRLVKELDAMPSKRKHAYWKKVVPFGGRIKKGDVEVLDKWVCSNCGLAMHGRAAEICPSCLSIMDAKPEGELCQHPKDWNRVIS